MFALPKRLVIASQNRGKLKEFAELFAEIDIELLSQADFAVPSAAETGSTFIENALIKARAVSRATQLAALADDSGLVVPALDGAPGIYSARYAGNHGGDAANNEKLVADLENITDRRAYFYCAIVLLQHSEDPTPLIACAAWHGQIVAQPAGDGGFGYDPHFLVDGMTVTAAELAKAQKNTLSHRGQATAKLLAELRAVR